MKRRLFIAAGIAFGCLVAFIIAVAISNWMIKDRVPVKLMSSFSVNGDRNYAFATGTMVTEGERNATPLQASEIKCNAHSKECVVASGRIAFGDSLYVMVDIYPVIEWTDSHLVFVEETSCVTNTYTLNWVTKSVSGIRVKRKDPPAWADCSLVLHDELRSTLRNGFDVWQEEQKRAYPAFVKMMVAFFSMF